MTEKRLEPLRGGHRPSGPPERHLRRERPLQVGCYHPPGPPYWRLRRARGTSRGAVAPPERPLVPEALFR
eukprot:11342351-Alexandrium_andersonii.AAC.1